MVADDVDDRRASAPRVVQVGKAVGETGTGVEQGRRRPTRHARIAIGRTGDDAFGEAENTAHLRLAIKGGDEVHFRRAGIGKTDIHVVCQKCIDEDVRTCGANRLAAFSHARVPPMAFAHVSCKRCGCKVGLQRRSMRRPSEVTSAARRDGRRARSAPCRRRAAAGAVPGWSGAS
ncbi:hypothetical protein D9M72_548850 [compost metagenome]